MKKGARTFQHDVDEARVTSIAVGKLGGLQKVALLVVAGFATSQLLPHAAVAATETAVPLVSAAADGTFVEKLTSSGFFQAFSLVFVSEIGDKTFFIAALLAAKTSRLISFAGSVGALAVMTVLAVLVGLAFHSVPSVFTSGLPVDDIVAAAAFLYFGIITLKDAYQLPDDSNEGIDEERAEAEESVKELAGKKTVWALVLQTFSLVFAAEFGDRSFLTTIALGAAQNPFGVATGAIAAHASATGIAVTGGALLSQYISEKGNSGQKGLDIAALKEVLQEIQLKNRTTIRSIAAALDIPKSTLFDDLKNLGLRSCSRFLKPLLSDDGKAQRLAWALRWVRSSPGGQRYYLYEGEDLPIRKVQHKSHVIKVMFLAAVARPRYDFGRNRQFAGKIGINPFTVQRAAQRNSRNRAAGTMVTHSVEVNRTTYKEKLIDNVFPDIRVKFPASPIIFAQQDNAPGHRVLEDPDVVAAAGQGAGRIELVDQPPNSPDCNILDLGFFNSIQYLHDRTTPTTVDQLVTEVERAFWAQKSEVLGRVWTTLQNVLQEIMLARGDNTFKLPHVRKQTAERRNEALPAELPCSQEAWVRSQATPAEGGGAGGGSA
eukprot:g12588.t1